MDNQNVIYLASTMATSMPKILHSKVNIFLIVSAIIGSMLISHSGTFRKRS